MSLPADAGITNIQYTAVGLCFQSLVYGQSSPVLHAQSKLSDEVNCNRHIRRSNAIFVSCPFVSVRDRLFACPCTQDMHRKRGLKSKSNMFTFGVTLFMFALSTAYWAASVANLIAKIQSIVIDPSERSTDDIITYHLLFNAVILINVSLQYDQSIFHLDIIPPQYVITDGVVVWRAWILCPNTSRWILLIPTISLALTFSMFLRHFGAKTSLKFSWATVSVFGTIGIRTTITISQARGIAVPNSSPLIHALNVSQVTNLVMTLITNVLATSIISRKAWYVHSSIELKSPNR